MAQIFEVTVTDSAWVDIYTITGIVVGTSMEIMNKGSQTSYITEATVIPGATDRVGKLMTAVGSNYAVAFISTGSDEIWCRTDSPLGTILAVQES